MLERLLRNDFHAHPLTAQKGKKRRTGLVPSPYRIKCRPHDEARPPNFSDMTTTTQLIRARRFLPLFVTQLLGAFNDNLFKNAMVLFVVYGVYNSETAEARFSALASGIFVIPFFLLSALAGQMADMRDKSRIIRIVKFCEILIMLVGAAGLAMAWQGIAVGTLALPLMLLALFAMGVHSTFSARSNMRSCRSTCAPTRCSAAPDWSKPAPTSRFSAEPCWRASFRWRRQRSACC